MTFGQLLKSRRELCELTQLELARKVGLTPAAICQYESDKRMPSLECFKKLLTVLPGSAETYMNYIEEAKKENES